MEPHVKQMESQKLFQQLVDELTKEKPSDSKVKTLTSKLGLPYRKDPIEQLDFILKSAGGFFFEAEVSEQK